MDSKYNQLTREEEVIIVHKGTEQPYSGEYIKNKRAGIYLCKRCSTPLYSSEDKFDSHCGWPSFDDEIAGAIKNIPDEDGHRTEIVCANCEAHLGHVFYDEGFTAKETRHCVNSLSLSFTQDETRALKNAYFASGCFWGTEYHFTKAKGVMHTAVGFMGGHVDHPTYEQVCSKNTGHLETTQVEYDADMISYEDLIRLFFETHDFTQTDGQGPDIGPQYLSCIFYFDEEQFAIATKYINILRARGYNVATKIEPASTFWQAEDYHQQYYDNKGTTPYCHKYKPIF